MQTQKGMGDEALMKLSQMFVLVMAVIGFVSLLNPDCIYDPKWQENMMLICRIAIAIFLLEFVPMLIRKIKSSTFQDIIVIGVVPVSTALAVSIVNPTMDQHLFTVIVFVMMFISIIGTTIFKNKLAKRWSAELNSYHSDETP